MEPMTLGSPGSPSPNLGSGGANSNFLPSYLMGGDPNVPSAPRSNTLSPTRGRTQLAFGNSPRNAAAANAAAAAGLDNSNADFNRSMSLLQQRSLFGGVGSGQPSTPGSMHNYSAHHPHHHQQHHQQQQQQQHQQQLNASLSGPPTMGLFDSLKATDTTANTTGGQYGTPRGPAGANTTAAVAAASAAANFSINQSYGAFNESSVNEAYLTQSEFNGSTLQRQFASPYADFRTPSAAQSATEHHLASPPSMRGHQQPVAPFWVTVFGFPPAAVNAMLAHFAQCGTIVDKVLPAHAGGNWMHLKYASRVECDKAVNFNERVIGNSMMIGVVYCRDAEIVDKENNVMGGEQMQQGKGGVNGSGVPVNRVRPLAQSAYHSSLSPGEVVRSPPVPKRSTGLVNKAMDMIFGW